MPELYDTVKSFKQLSCDFLKILDQEETFDVIIYVGDESSSETFKAHSIILKTRSEYFRAALSAAWGKKKEDGFYVIDLRGMNIPQAIFGHVLLYVWTIFYFTLFDFYYFFSLAVISFHSFVLSFQRVFFFKNKKE